MSTKLKKFCRAVSLLSLGLLLTLGAAAPAGAKTAHKKGSSHHHMAKVKGKGKGKTKARSTCKSRNVLHHLGLYRPSRLYPDAPLDTVDKLKKAFADEEFQRAVQKVFADENLGSVAPELFKAVENLPSDARPRDIKVGTKIDWMGYRKKGRPRAMSDVCWAGDESFKGWTFSVPGGPGGMVAVVVPVPCGNVSGVASPICKLKVDQDGSSAVLDITGSTPGIAPIVSYHSQPELPQSTPGRFQVAGPVKCDPGARCYSVKEELWVEDDLGFRSAPGQCPYEIPGYEQAPVCKLVVTFANDNFHVDATGSGVKVQSFTVTGKSDGGGATVSGTVPPGQWTTDIPYTPAKSERWTFTGDEVGENGKHADPQSCYSKVLACVKPTAVLKAAYDCSTRQLTLDATGSSIHQVVTVMPNDTDPLSGTGPIWTAGVKHSGTYTVELTADDAICPDKAMATATVTVPPFGDTARWTLRAFGAYVRASSDSSERSSATAVDYRQKLNLGAHHGGFGAGFEYRPLVGCDLKRWGIAVDAIHSELDSHLLVDRSNAWGRVQETVNFTPVLLSLNYHLTPNKPVDVFIGPSIGYAFLDSVTYNTLGASYSEKFDDDLTYGINLGLDVPFGTEHNYAFTAGLRQLFFKAKGSGTLGHNFDLNPTIATAGIAFRFR